MENVIDFGKQKFENGCKKLEAALSASTGKHVSLEARIDESLLGGVRVTLAGTLYDGTARGRLETLRQRLEDVELG